MATLFPSLLLVITPACDIVRAITGNPAWSRAAVWTAFAAVAAVAVAAIPRILDWLAIDRHTRARAAGLAPLTLHIAAFFPLALGAVERVHGMPLAWPFALAIAGLFAWLGGEWMTESRIDAGVRIAAPARRATRRRDERTRRYQPIGLPSRA